MYRPKNLYTSLKEYFKLKISLFSIVYVRFEVNTDLMMNIIPHTFLKRNQRNLTYLNVMCPELCYFIFRYLITFNIYFFRLIWLKVLILYICAQHARARQVMQTHSFQSVKYLCTRNSISSLEYTTHLKYQSS